MPPEDAKTLSISTDTYGGALVVRATGELDYDYAPVFRRELTRLWNTGAGASPAQPPPSPSREPSPAFPGASPLLPGSPFSPAASSMGGGPLSPAPLTPDGSFSGEGSFSMDDSFSVDDPLASDPSFLPARSAPSPEAAAGTATGAATGAAAGAAPSWLILDLTGLTFCDSTGLAELLWSLRQSQETGTRLVVAGASRTLCHMLATTGLLAFFTMAGSVEEALLEAGAGTPEER